MASNSDTKQQNNRPSSSRSTRQSRASGPTSSKSTGGKEGQSFVVALVEGRGTGAEVGMCFCDLKTSEVILCQVQAHVLSLRENMFYATAVYEF